MSVREEENETQADERCRENRTCLESAGDVESENESLLRNRSKIRGCDEYHRLFKSQELSSDGYFDAAKKDKESTNGSALQYVDEIMKTPLLPIQISQPATGMKSPNSDLFENCPLFSVNF